MLRNNLAKLMIDRGITATQLFNDTGIARSTISKISNNNTDKISLSTIDKICNYLEVSPSDFFDFWPYDIKIKCGFNNHESLEDALKNLQDEKDTFDIFSTVTDISTLCYLLIEFRRGKDFKKLLEFELTYTFEYERGMPTELLPGIASSLSDITYIGDPSTLLIFKDIPVQFRNELIEQIRNNFLEVFSTSGGKEMEQYFERCFSGKLAEDSNFK